MLGGEKPAQIVRLSLAGKIQWRYELTERSFTVAFPSQLIAGQNGSVLCAYGVVDEDITRYLLFAPGGSIALDDTLHEVWINLSPDGEYFFNARQSGKEIVLNGVGGKVKKLEVPPILTGEDRLNTLGFASPGQLMVVQSLGDGSCAVGLFDLRSEPARWTALQFPQGHCPTVPYPFQVGFGRGEEFLYIDDFAATHMQSKVTCFDRDGSLLWQNEMRPGESRWTAPRWVVMAEDQAFAALFDANWVGIIETRSGRLIDSQMLDADLIWMYESSFRQGRILVAGQGGLSGGDPLVLDVAVLADGTISKCEKQEVMIRGLTSDQQSGAIVLDEGSSNSWLVTGFKR